MQNPPQNVTTIRKFVSGFNGKEEEWMLDAGSGTHTHRYGVSDFIFLASAYENVCLIFPLKSVRSV